MLAYDAVELCAQTCALALRGAQIAPERELQLSQQQQLLLREQTHLCRVDAHAVRAPARFAQTLHEFRAQVRLLPALHRRAAALERPLFAQLLLEFVRALGAPSVEFAPRVRCVTIKQ